MSTLLLFLWFKKYLHKKIKLRSSEIWCYLLCMWNRFGAMKHTRVWSTGWCWTQRRKGFQFHSLWTLHITPWCSHCKSLLITKTHLNIGLTVGATSLLPESAVTSWNLMLKMSRFLISRSINLHLHLEGAYIS